MTEADRQCWAPEASDGAAVHSARCIDWRFELAVLTASMVLAATALAVWPH